MSPFHDFEICREILESLPTGLCVVDLEKRIVFWSQGAERITGHRKHEVIGQFRITEPLLYCDQPGREYAGESCPLARAIKAARPAEATGFLHHKDGHQVPVWARAVPVRDGHGSVIGVVAVFNDQDNSAALHPRENRDPLRSDPATGAVSRDMLHSLLREALAAFSDMQAPFGILGIRLEHLEPFRAAFGPEAASSLLRVVARTLESALWRTDFVGRWSDAEFLVILNGCREDGLSSVRERLRRMLANDAIEWWGERRSLPLSIGQAMPRPGDTVDTLLARAHASLHAASTRHARSAVASAHASSKNSGATSGS